MVRILNQTLGPSEGVGPELSGRRSNLITRVKWFTERKMNTNLYRKLCKGFALAIGGESIEASNDHMGTGQKS